MRTCDSRIEHSMSLFGIMTVAAVAGATLALLFAPRAGSETREEIKRQVHLAKESSLDKIERAKSKARSSVDGVKGKADEALIEVQDTAYEARSQVEDALAESKPRIRRTGPQL